ncbi:hypothetical protein CDAR_75001 [Caerostris darwini]|uniref:Uncharacterized protein n=1 Tax=Caerostris darwini TaxID=1538125 RepID=A0AAV4P0L7_9ARAC|nr:hypothetical protein CDAR_75001 [Caerostris darwini]
MRVISQEISTGYPQFPTFGVFCSSREICALAISASPSPLREKECPFPDISARPLSDNEFPATFLINGRPPRFTHWQISASPSPLRDKGCPLPTFSLDSYLTTNFLLLFLLMGARLYLISPVLKQDGVSPCKNKTPKKKNGVKEGKKKNVLGYHFPQVENVPNFWNNV